MSVAGIYTTARENWRVTFLVFVLILSSVALFAPTGGGTGADAAPNSTVTNGTTPAPTVNDTGDSGMTNLQYGIQLSGGTRIRAPLQGYVANDVDIGGRDSTAVEQAVAAELPNTDAGDVTVRGPSSEFNRNTPAIELTSNATQSEFTAALDAAGVEYGAVSSGVTGETREETVRVLRSKINQAGLSGGSVTTITDESGQRFVVVTVPNENPESVVDLVQSRGEVEVLAYYPTEENNETVYRNRTVLTQDDFANIGVAEQQQSGGGAFVPVQVREEAAPRFQADMVETGIARPGGSGCGWPSESGTCLLVTVDDRVVASYGMRASLAESMVDGSWVQDSGFQLLAANISEAQSVAISLRAGALPAALSVAEGDVLYVAPSLGAEFRTNSLITALIAVFAVSGVVFVRYGEAKVAAPMVVTALSEVLILLGFAAAIGYPLDLSVIAGFIAVIGTGVDDLIIIADEVMSEGEVNSRRVFQSRFRKAFWVIGAAAATTIVAMSPLAVLSLGDLQGFAIFTILGVLVGVLLTRPAYGDILRALLTER
ncbi:preprotein translocase subunit SecD [Salinirubrum litoreum]|uniref:Protein-export membrane protein SecD n=1 Tax=Salinirubrum litoreum TaxID=1126234 RepID=A0ABD5R8X1_9EURY|nr:preprotein translocase subunit SecD [Salinirubrum litoreum]